MFSWGTHGVHYDLHLCGKTVAKQGLEEKLHIKDDSCFLLYFTEHTVFDSASSKYMRCLVWSVYLCLSCLAHRISTTQPKLLPKGSFVFSHHLACVGCGSAEAKGDHDQV